MKRLKKHFVVVGYIINDKNVLLVHHRKLGLWLPVGGHIEANETPEDALKREAKEEADIEIEIAGSRDEAGDVKGTVEVLTNPDHIQLEDIDARHQHIDLAYFARTRSSSVKLKADEHHEIRWFSEKELDSPDITANVRHFARKAIKELG